MRVVRKSQLLKALDTLRAGGVMIREGGEFYLIPGKRLDPAVATKLKEQQLDFGESSEEEDYAPPRYEKPRRVVEPQFVRERPTIGFL